MAQMPARPAVKPMAARPASVPKTNFTAPRQGDGKADPAPAAPAPPPPAPPANPQPQPEPVPAPPPLNEDDLAAKEKALAEPLPEAEPLPKITFPSYYLSLNRCKTYSNARSRQSSYRFDYRI